MRDEDVKKLLVRGWSLLCASVSMAGNGHVGAGRVRARAKNFESFLNDVLPDDVESEEA